MAIVKQIGTKKRGNPAWGNGKSGNPNGRPKSPEAEILRQALESAKSKHKGVHLIQHAVNHAYVNEQLCVAILKKILPDKVENDFIKDFEIKINVIKKYPELVEIRNGFKKIEMRK
jgi:hypothetical protein